MEFEGRLQVIIQINMCYIKSHFILKTLIKNTHQSLNKFLGNSVKISKQLLISSLMVMTKHRKYPYQQGFPYTFPKVSLKLPQQKRHLQTCPKIIRQSYRQHLLCKIALKLYRNFTDSICSVKLPYNRTEILQKQVVLQKFYRQHLICKIALQMYRNITD